MSKERWDQMLGPSYWRCMNLECPLHRKLIRKSYTATYGQCSECKKSLYRSKPEPDDEVPLPH